TFTYDPDGNQTSGLGRSIVYTSYNKPLSITQGARTISFLDDTDHQRFKQVTPEGTTLYIAAFGLLAEVNNPGTTSARWTDYLAVGDAMVGMRVLQVASETLSTRYFHSDHLGSISVITDEHGVVLERLSYDAWGKRRFPSGADDPTGSITSQTTRGFTGEEELSVSGLVHLNGRVYDPLLARMTSADSTVSRPLSSQGWNRYSYVRNMPLKRIDPSGYCDVSVDTLEEIECHEEESRMLPPVTVDPPPEPTAPTAPTVTYCYGCSTGTDGGASGSIVVDLAGSYGGIGNLDLAWDFSVSQYVTASGYGGGGASVTAPLASIAAQSITSLNSGSASAYIHGALAVGSFAPSVLGTAVSAVDGLLYWAEGDRVNAGIALGAAVLGIGADAGLVRLGLKGVQLGADTLKGLEGALMDSSVIRFTQDSVSGTFRDGRTLQEMVDALRSGAINPSDISPIRIFGAEGKLFSLDNRRLLAAKLAESPISVRAATANEIRSQAYKFTTPNKGCIICLRNGFVNLER
ncbi:MAG TPA: RHS repeat-associated core domain-containing protein, partial [Bradyrhizobium sp.]|nr:RHS repeat-associated core domain-containing protein [Bradyrhizobium sp.]